MKKSITKRICNNIFCRIRNTGIFNKMSDEKYLKMFKDCTSLYIKSRRDPVLVYKYGFPYGVILPMHIEPMEGE